VLPQAVGFEQRLGELEAQIERLTLALVRWRETEEHRQPVERRIAQLTEQCEDLVRSATATSERHAQAVGELESRLTGWNDIETRLQREAASRLQLLERTIEREWAALRHLHEEPVRELRAHAETLTEISVNAAGSAQTGIERAEARLATLERDVHRRIDELSRDLHAVLTQLREHGVAALTGPARSWPLDEVTRLHDELRSGAVADDTARPDGAAPRPATGLAPRADRRVFDVGESASDASAAAGGAATPPAESAAPPVRDEVAKEIDDILHEDVDDEPAASIRWRWYAAFAALFLIVGIAAWVAVSFYAKANEAALRAAEAQQRAERIATAASAGIEAARVDASSQIARAREAAAKAQIATDVLAASDLVRFNLIGGDGTARMSGQLLWSRSRGLVFTASRVPPPPSGKAYQIWLLTAGDPVSAGTVVPDASGRVSFATDAPPSVPRPILGVRVTAEPSAGSSTPTGAVVLGRVSS
jgi:hypothetical protein